MPKSIGGVIPSAASVERPIFIRTRLISGVRHVKHGYSPNERLVINLDLVELCAPFEFCGDVLGAGGAGECNGELVVVGGKLSELLVGVIGVEHGKPVSDLWGFSFFGAVSSPRAGYSVVGHSIG